MEDIKTWWDLARQVGPGATLVLVVVVIALWRDRSIERKYARERDKTVAARMEKFVLLLDKEATSSVQCIEAVKDGRDQTIKVVENSRDMIIKNIDQRKR